MRINVLKNEDIVKANIEVYDSTRADYEVEVNNGDSYQEIRDYRIIDVDGFITGEVTDYPVSEATEFYIDIPLEGNFVKPKWQLTQWVEGATESELQTDQALKNRQKDIANGGYGTWREQLEMINEQGLTAWQDHCATVKTNNPKGV